MSRSQHLGRDGVGDATDACAMQKAYDALTAEVDGHTCADIEELMKYFLESRPWSRSACTVAAKVATPTVLIRGSFKTFAAWLDNLQTVARLHHTSGQRISKFTWLEWKPQRSSLLLSAGDVEDNGEGSSALALGEMSTGGTYQSGFYNLHSRAKAVFASQPDRVLLHAFYLYGSMLEVWVFDRAGLYGSKAVDVTETPSLLTRLLASYLLMDSTSLGVGDLIKRDCFGNYIECSADSPTAKTKFYLGEQPIFARVEKTIVGDGLTCYRAKAGSTGECKYAVKVKWSEPEDKSEARLLQLATEKHVWGVSQLVRHEAVCCTNDWRQGLRLESSRKFDPKSREIGLLGTYSALDRTAERASNNAPTSDPPHASIEDKVLNCVVVTPLGDSLHRFQSVPVLLRALRDAVKAHRSLYLDAGILHQDICPGNILIPTSIKGSEQGHEAHGVLIDLDAARLATAPSPQFESVGTPLFKAIGVLQAYLPNNPHTYRHDLESFFYTFVFLAICHRPVPAGENQLQLPEASALQMWTQGRPVDRARCKINDMHAENFRVILSEFTPEFSGLRGLAEEIRGLLFPMKDGQLWTGTDGTIQGTSSLYNKMIEAFDGGAKLACSL